MTDERLRYNTEIRPLSAGIYVCPTTVKRKTIRHVTTKHTFPSQRNRLLPVIAKRHPLDDSARYWQMAVGQA